MLRQSLKLLSSHRILLPQRYTPFTSRVRMTANLQQPLDFNAGPLVWIDCEMTGLNPKKDKILEIAVRVSFYFIAVS